MRAHQTVSAHRFIIKNLFKVFDFIYIHNSFKSALLELEGMMTTSPMAWLTYKTMLYLLMILLAWCDSTSTCLKRVPSAPQRRLWSTSWIFKLTLLSTMKANTRPQMELPQDLILMDLTSLCLNTRFFRRSDLILVSCSKGLRYHLSCWGQSKNLYLLCLSVTWI